MKLFNADAIVRSKDAGPFRFTLDVIFNDRNQFEAMKDSGIWNREYLCKLCRSFVHILGPPPSDGAIITQKKASVFLLSLQYVYFFT